MHFDPRVDLFPPIVCATRCALWSPGSRRNLPDQREPSIIVATRDSRGFGQQFAQAIPELFRYRGLLWLWAWRGIKARYQQTALGVSWALFTPLALTATYAVVFSVFIKVETEGIPYPIFVYTGVLPWALFASSMSLGVPSVVQNADLVSKIYFPREILPLASLGIPLMDFLAGVGVLLLLLPLFGVAITGWLLLIPILLLVQVVFTIGLLFYASALNVMLRDVGHLVPPLLLIGQFAAPIIYPVELVPEAIRPLYLLNPMAALIDSYRRLLLHGTSPAWGYVLIAAIISVALLASGYAFFKRADRDFADVI